MKDIAEKIKDYNSDRIPEILKLKYMAMRNDKYRFFRAIPNIQYGDIPKKSFLFDAPDVWLCGDLHLENLGSYKGDNRVTYFGVNDFDECILGPFLIDISRMLSSIYVSADSLKLNVNDARALCKVFVNAYFERLREGYIRELEQERAQGVMRDFLLQVQKRKRKEFLKKKMVRKNGKIFIDDIHTLPISKKEKNKITEHIGNWAKGTTDPNFFEVKDVAFRIAGTSSLGIERYAILVEGRGGDDGMFLLDLKQTLPSCLEKYIKTKQPHWKNNGEKIVEVQKRTLSAPPALLSSIDIGKKNFVLKELQPSADRINYTLFAGNTKKLAIILNDMGSICAWSNLRSGGRDGSAIADKLISFVDKNDKLKKELIENAYQTLKDTNTYYKDFCKAYDKGYFKINDK